MEQGDDYLISSYPITTSLKIVKELQYVKETLAGITPTNPSFVAIPTKEFTPRITTKSKKYIKIGAQADIYKDILIRKNYDLEINYTPVDDSLLESMINVTGTNSRNDTYTFLFSQQHNSAGSLVEQYQIARGCSPSQVKILVKDGELVTITSKWKALSISDWSSSHGLTGTPIFASTISGIPYSAVTTGSEPFSYDGQSYDIRRFSATVKHNLDVIQVEGQSEITRIIPTLSDISLEVDVVYKDATLQQATKAFIDKDVTMKLNALLAPSLITLQFSDVWLEEYNEEVDAKKTKTKVVSYVGTAAALSLLINRIVLADSIHKYNIFGVTSILQTSIQKYNIVGITLVTATSIQKYNLASIVSATSVQKYNITGTGLINFDSNNFDASNFI